MENATIFVEVRQEGVVDRVLVTTNQEGHRVVKVKIRHVRKPVLGDKFACYMPDHEVFTVRGWKKIDELTKDDLVLTLDEYGGGTRYSHPSAIQSYDYSGKMYTISSDKVDLCVTPNHRMYVMKNKIFEILRADEIYGKKVTYSNLSEDFEFDGNNEN